MPIGSIANCGRLAHERIVGELPHQEVGYVRPRNVRAPSRFQTLPRKVVVRPGPVCQDHRTYNDPLDITLPHDPLLCLLVCVLIPEQRRHEYLHEERTRIPRILLALPHTPRRLAHEAPQTVLLHRRDNVPGTDRSHSIRVTRTARA